MKLHGLYYTKADYKQLVTQAGGTWSDPKDRPMVCLIQSNEHPQMYWAIPMGNLSHRNEEQIKRLRRFIDLPERDLRSCYYHIGRTTVDSIFFISDIYPITEKYIERGYLYGKDFYVIKNVELIAELERKAKRILAAENAKPDTFRQHITSTKQLLLSELNGETE